MMRFVVVAGLLGALTWSGPALADGSPSGDVRVAVAGGGPLADLELLPPGITRSGTLTVTNRGLDPVVLHVRAVGIVEREDGCGPDEAMLDSSCEAGDGRGELGEAAEFRIWDMAGSAGAPAFEGSIYELRGVALGTRPLGPGESTTFRFDYGLPTGAGNDSQGDRLAFDLDVSAQQRGAIVGGVTVERVPGARLPNTGRDVGRLVGAASAAVLSGAGLVLLGRTRRRGRSGVAA